MIAVWMTVVAVAALVCAVRAALWRVPVSATTASAGVARVGPLTHATWVALPLAVLVLIIAWTLSALL